MKSLSLVWVDLELFSRVSGIVNGEVITQVIMKMRSMDRTPTFSNPPRLLVETVQPNNVHDQEEIVIEFAKLFKRGSKTFSEHENLHLDLQQRGITTSEIQAILMIREVTDKLVTKTPSTVASFATSTNTCRGGKKPAAAPSICWSTSGGHGRFIPSAALPTALWRRQTN